MLSTWKIEEGDYIGTGQLDTGPNISTLSNALTTDIATGPIPVILQGEPDSGLNAGYDKLYIGATTPDGTANFETSVHTTGVQDVSALSATVTGLDDGSSGNPLLTSKFAIGDIIYATDGIILGEIDTIPSASVLTFKTDGSKRYHAGGEVLFTNADGIAAWQTQNGAADAGDLANNDELYNLHPITLILHFEK